MKKIFLVLFFSFWISGIIAQNPFSKYEKVDSLPLEMISVHVSGKIEEKEGVVNMGGGDYLLKMPEKHKMVILTTPERDKAIIIHRSIFVSRYFSDLKGIGRFFRSPQHDFREFTIEENERRLILWFKDSRIYCGYIYDKRYKVCLYFEKREKEWSGFKRGFGSWIGTRK